MPDDHPTDERIQEYIRRLEAIRESRQWGKDTSEMEAELKRFTLATGFAEECPVDEDGEPL